MGAGVGSSTTHTRIQSTAHTRIRIPGQLIRGASGLMARRMGSSGASAGAARLSASPSAKPQAGPRAPYAEVSMRVLRF
jgi:hypothetical protein